MRLKLWSDSITSRSYQTKPYKPKHPREHPFFDRQQLIPEFDHTALESAEVAVIGAGGLNSWPALGLTQAGIKKIVLCDRDRLEVSNCNRQFYRPTSVGRYKVDALGKELAAFGAGQTTIEAFPYHFEDMVALYGTNAFSTCRLAVIGVDSEESRIAASSHFRALQIPAIFSGVSLEGKTGFVFIQSPEADQPCYGCVYPQVVNALGNEAPAAEHFPCPRTPAMSPILHALSGLILEAIFSVLMPNLYHGWNHFTFCIDKSMPSGGSMRTRLADCLLCASHAEHN
jgi:molybdopterin/thiamine biosynthesis adenylyltransferase